MRRPTTSILEQFQTLHMDNTIVIDLRELLRIHKATLSVVQQGLDAIRKQNYSHSHSQSNNTRWEENETLEERFKFNAQLLEYYDVTATTLIEQQNNLLNLVSLYSARQVLVNHYLGLQPGDSYTGPCSSKA
jgi:hypothetical protein